MRTVMLSTAPPTVAVMQNLLIGRLRAEDEAGDAVSAVLDMLRQPDPELAVMIYGQGG